MNKDDFEEVQKMDSLWPLLIIALTAVFNWFLYFYLGHTDMSFFYSSMMSVALLAMFLSSLRLYTRVNEEGISFRYFPFHFRWKLITWDEISAHQVRQFNPWKEFGGWGLKWSRAGWSYTISGRMALEIKLHENAKNIIIGTQNPEKLEEILALYRKKTAKRK
jgi:hypothetical protein